MSENQIGGSNFLGLGDDKDDKNKLPSPRQDNEEIEPLQAPRLTHKESKKQQFFPEEPKSQMPAQLDLSRQEDRDEQDGQDENDEQDDRLKANAPRPQFNEERGEEERVFFREQPKSQMPAQLDLSRQEDRDEQDKNDEQDDRLKLNAPRPKDDEQVFFPETKKSTSPRPAPKESDKDEKKKPIIKSAIDFLMAPFTTESEEEDKNAPDNFQRKKKN